MLCVQTASGLTAAGGQQRGYEGFGDAMGCPVGRLQLVVLPAAAGGTTATQRPCWMAQKAL